MRRSTSRTDSKYWFTRLRSPGPSVCWIRVSSSTTESRRLACFLNAARRSAAELSSPKRFSNTIRGCASAGSGVVGEDLVATHHGSLSRARRHDAEQRLKAGRLRALVATASLELGIDIGDVDLVLQVGGTRSIATFLQRAGRAGHGVGRTPKARIFPLTMDELVEAAAILRAVKRGVLDRTPQPSAASARSS